MNGNDANGGGSDDVDFAGGGEDSRMEEEIEWAPGEHLIRAVEVIAEHFFSRAPERPKEIGDVPVFVHCLDFSLGTPGDVDAAYLSQVKDVVNRLDAVILSDHLAFTRTGEVELGHLNPVPPTLENAKLIAQKIRGIQEEIAVPFLLENITTHLSIAGDLNAGEFFQRVVDEADCGMLLDVTNIVVNCRNRGYDPMRFVDELDLARVYQLHIVGYSENQGTLFDSHVVDISEDLFQFAREVIERAPVEAIIIERDGHWPKEEVLRGELATLQGILDDKRQRMETSS